MKLTRQHLLGVSVLFNLALVAAVGYQYYFLKQHRDVVASPSSVTIAQWEPAPILQPAKTTTPNLDQRNPSAPFDWRQIESSDYRTYIANLRAIDCPEQTICDIITADVNTLYEGRKAALHPDAGQTYKFWETAEHNHLPASQAAEIEKQLAALETEKLAVLQELLGGGCPQTPLSDHDADMNRRLAFLSPQQQIQARAIEDRYPGLNDRIQAMVDKGSVDEHPAELMQAVDLYNQKKAELIQLLGTNDYEQYDLATSWSADNVRKGLRGFNPTEDEFRAIFDVWRAQDENLATIYATGQPDPGVQPVNDAIQAILGDDRYQQYAHAWGNDDYHQVAELAYDYQLPQDTPDQLYNLKQQAQAQQQQLLSDPSLTEQQRTAALQNLQTQTIQATTQQLGPDAYQTYLQGNGNWIQNLGPPGK